jgi:asparagine synthase (glutamine-hydrolysing)
MDQPTFDGINTYVVAAAARRSGFKVSLSGLGADELLDGYGMGRRVRLLTAAGGIPRLIRGHVPVRLIDPSGAHTEKLKAWMAQPGGAVEAVRLLRSLFRSDEIRSLVPSADGAGSPDGDTEPVDPRSPMDVAWLDMSRYMRNILLRDADCMCMANSLELRVPFLDNGVVDFVLSLPNAVRARQKRLMVDAFGDLLPREVLDRRKQGFLLPIGPWMASTLGEDVSAQLREPPEGLRALLDTVAVQSVWDDFRATGKHWLRPWSLFSLFTWWSSVEAEARTFGRSPSS